jgi:hypothetical protein
MLSWLASFLVFFLQNDSAKVTAVQQNSTGAATTQTLHEAGGVPIGNGNSNGGPT